MNVDETTDSTILKVKVIRLKTELRKKENDRRAMEDELLETKLALTAKSEEVESLKLDVDIKQEAVESALAKVNLLEEKTFPCYDRILLAFHYTSLLQQRAGI